MQYIDQIKILSFFEIFALISKEKTAYNIVSIRSPEESEEIQNAFRKYKNNYNSVFVMSFDDISEPMPGYIMPKKQDIENMLDWSKEKDNLLVHCSAGISRSSAVAYLIECTKKPPHEAVKVLNPAIHLPNRFILEMGCQILDNPDILEILKKAKPSANSLCPPIVSLGENE